MEEELNVGTQWRCGGKRDRDQVKNTGQGIGGVLET